MFLGCQVCRGNLKGEISVANVAHCREIRKSPLEFLEGEIEILCNAIVERWRTVGAHRERKTNLNPTVAWSMDVDRRHTKNSTFFRELWG